MTEYERDLVDCALQAMKLLDDDGRRELWRKMKENAICTQCGTFISSWGCADCGVDPHRWINSDVATNVLRGPKDAG